MGRKKIVPRFVLKISERSFSLDQKYIVKYTVQYAVKDAVTWACGCDATCGQCCVHAVEQHAVLAFPFYRSNLNIEGWFTYYTVTASVLSEATQLAYTCVSPPASLCPQMSGRGRKGESTAHSVSPRPHRASISVLVFNWLKTDTWCKERGRALAI